jgi:hypothetical protein
MERANRRSTAGFEDLQPKPLHRHDWQVCCAKRGFTFVLHVFSAANSFGQSAVDHESGSPYLPNMRPVQKPDRSYAPFRSSCFSSPPSRDVQRMWERRIEATVTLLRGRVLPQDDDRRALSLGRVH